MLFSREKREEREQNTKIIKESNAFRVLCVFRGYKKIGVYLRSSVDNIYLHFLYRLPVPAWFPCRCNHVGHIGTLQQPCR
jgi:hypothetical protein